MCSKGPAWMIPASFTSTSTGPRDSSTCSSASMTWPRTRTSHGVARTFAPLAASGGSSERASDGGSAHVAELLESARRERGDLRLLLGRRVDERRPLEGPAQQPQLLVVELEGHGRSPPPDVHGRSFRKTHCQ